MPRTRITKHAATTGAHAPVVRFLHPTRGKIGIALMIVGLLGMAVPFISFGLSRDEGVLLQSMSPLASGSAAVIETPKPKRIADRLVIAKQGIDMPLVDWRNEAAALSVGAWVWPDTSRPGTHGNTVIFGHRFRYLPPMSNTLFKLDRVAIGDRITVRWHGAEYTYAVTNKRIIEPTDLSVLQPTTEEQITIITCTPVFSTKQRLVVTATRI